MKRASDCIKTFSSPSFVLQSCHLRISKNKDQITKGFVDDHIRSLMLLLVSYYNLLGEQIDDQFTIRQQYHEIE